MSQHSNAPSISLPSRPPPVHSGSSFGRRTPQRLSRPGSTAPWDAFDHDSDLGHDEPGAVLESTPRWKQNVAGWRRGVHPDASPTASTYTSVYPLSTMPSMSQSSFFDSESPLSGESVLYSDEMGCSDTFGARATPDWAPWLSNSPPSTPRRSHMLEEALVPALAARSRAFRGPILKTSTTFYLPPLYTQQRPTFATPRRPPRPSSRASTSTTTTTSSKAREGCFAFCTGRGKPTGSGKTTPRDMEDKRPPQRRPPMATRGKHYRISFVQDRQWRANILNQAVEESLTSALFPMPPKPSKSKHTRHRSSDYKPLK
ncbi:hypothetical protein CC85DRAFT_282458 [Cutaneotrichosporon oleaginosum]|uniref:Uncharacterized protein n=1 Tax=Cutaneotrichosporon oleaginosum TaxID=879819 RepID=A0A0J0XWG9_9TREE|nr:uncharacterized protein CC85DRAFT_282458 [Cutaneotrichosporon oleaginosum]KLT45398.1 hypothetical protein CC85DRAFT_282458 [Cutaneotrichosporon oleaginosum]TXT14638.1 hypothetical protein COLE_00831 [Cutaneotrichosporon oleaginosum]